MKSRVFILLHNPMVNKTLHNQLKQEVISSWVRSKALSAVKEKTEVDILNFVREREKDPDLKHTEYTEALKTKAQITLEYEYTNDLKKWVNLQTFKTTLAPDIEKWFDQEISAQLALFKAPSTEEKKSSSEPSASTLSAPNQNILVLEANFCQPSTTDTDVAKEIIRFLKEKNYLQFFSKIHLVSATQEALEAMQKYIKSELAESHPILTCDIHQPSSKIPFSKELTFTQAERLKAEQKKLRQAAEEAERKEEEKLRQAAIAQAERFRKAQEEKAERIRKEQAEKAKAERLLKEQAEREKAEAERLRKEEDLRLKEALATAARFRITQEEKAERVRKEQAEKEKAVQAADKTRESMVNTFIDILGRIKAEQERLRVETAESARMERLESSTSHVVSVESPGSTGSGGGTTLTPLTVSSPVSEGSGGSATVSSPTVITPVSTGSGGGSCISSPKIPSSGSTGGTAASPGNLPTATICLGIFGGKPPVSISKAKKVASGLTIVTNVPAKTVSTAPDCPKPPKILTINTGGSGGSATATPLASPGGSAQSTDSVLSPPFTPSTSTSFAGTPSSSASYASTPSSSSSSLAPTPSSSSSSLGGTPTSPRSRANSYFEAPSPFPGLEVVDEESPGKSLSPGASPSPR